MTISEIATLAQNAGFAGDDLTTAVAIALAESGGNPNAHGDTTIGTETGSFGLWQIYSDAHPEYGPDFTTLYDPETNANAAFAIYTAAGNSFTPWSSYKTGTYQGFMNSAAEAVAGLVSSISENPGASIGIVLIIGLALMFLFKRA